nr:hypothetical protein [Massilia sp. TS11]
MTSLDAFRGFTIAAMVLVNNPGDWGNLYSQLAHAEWNGWTFTDWIFPFFLFIGGVAMALSLGRLAAAGADKPALLRKLSLRAALIFAIGFLLNFYPNFDLAHVRIPGVLQRIALCTLLAAPVVVYCNWRQQLGVILALFTLYSVLMLGVDVPGSGRAVLLPGQDFGAWLDRQLLGGHLWAKAKTWDPEGLVSTLPAVGSQLFGVLCGQWLLSPRPRAEHAVWMLLVGLLGVWLGNVLDVVLMPINKSLWTPSYAVFTAGWAAVLFAAFYWLLDGVRDPIAVRWCQPFVIYGMNALFIFAFSGFLVKTLSKLGLTSMLYAPIRALPIGPVNTSLLYALCFNAVMFSIAWMMWRRQWFIKV